MSDNSDRFNSLSLAFAEELYAQYAKDPQSVPADWRSYFDQMSREGGGALGFKTRPSFKPGSIFNPGGNGHVNGAARKRPPRVVTGAENDSIAHLQDRVDQLVRNYRVRGHRLAQLDPLGMPSEYYPELDPEAYGFTSGDLDRPVSSDTLPGAEVRTLREVIQRLRNTYCRYIGAQFMHIDDLEVRNWLQQRMESTENRVNLGRDEQLRILTRLTDAVIFEDFLHKKFTYAKSFSLEGAESLIPLLDLAFETAGDHGVREIVLGMPHRGRLNVLTNLMGKKPSDIFREFEDVDPELYVGKGDVKYHLGYSNDWYTSSGRKVHLSLCFNPSHLEFVNPVAMGRMRAKMDRCGDRFRERGLTLLIHGDAAFAGEGVVQETLNLSQLAPYTVGGALHVIVNNQIGFTTPPQQGRSSFYATDVAKMLQIPIFHVNGEHPEAVAAVVRLALDFRKAFKRDVVIDMYCYRRYGHNEGDEPTFTQPLLYRAIEQRPSVREGYLSHLLNLDGITREEADRIAEERTERLERCLTNAREKGYVRQSDSLAGVWKGYLGGPDPEVDEVDTTVPAERAATLMDAATTVPDSFTVNPKIARILKNRREMGTGERPLDWAGAELLAFASLACDGYRIRMTGQDVERGTFSHRHAVLHDYETGQTHTPLRHLHSDQAPVDICNSPLSETAVLGFEYGYSLDWPDGLVLWEAQFGDFVNVAQVILDQFITSAEDKWRRLSSLVLLLPHGMEGMGPEHSSARLERFLMQAAEDNIQVVNLTTPAQYFHCLRRQVLRRWRKPLVVMSPKSLLRHPNAVSPLDEMIEGRFHRILPGFQPEDPQRVERVLLCSGKVYYDLEQHRAEQERDDVAILRVEQLYPLSLNALEALLSPYADGTPLVWVQEEPRNMGAWQFMRLRLGETAFGRFPLHEACRPESASPATGSHSSHKLEQEDLLARAFGELVAERPSDAALERAAAKAETAPNTARA